MANWTEPAELTEREERVLRLCKKRPLYRFLVVNRHLIFDAEMVAEVEGMYAGTGRPPEDPVRMAMAMLMQVGFGEPDHEVPVLTAIDQRWRMVLDLLDEPEEPAFSQGSVFNFRMRAIAHGLAKTLLDKTVIVARQAKGFSHRRLRAVFDSSPLLGAGRVEDTINLIGHAVGQLVRVAAAEAGRNESELADELGLTVVTASSVKAALDVDWREPKARNEALNTLIEQVRRLEVWLNEQFTEAQRANQHLEEKMATVRRLIEQDTEPDPDPADPDGGGPEAAIDGADTDDVLPKRAGAGHTETPHAGSKPNAKSQRGARRRIRRNEEVTGKLNRQVSLADPDMRHGRKSKTQRFAGYKRHVAADADVPGLVCHVALLPANRAEHDAAEPLLEGLNDDGWYLEELHHDRGYLPSSAIHERRVSGLRVISKPPAPRRGSRFGKQDFEIDFVARTATCPGGQTVPISPKGSATFKRLVCRTCPLGGRCLPRSGRRQIQLHPHEAFFREMGAELSTAAGRASRRQRTVVEHVLAHTGAIQGRRARFMGLEKNLFDLQRAAAVNNLFVIDRLLAAA